METISWGGGSEWGKGGGSGPWVLADLEAGVFGGDGPTRSSDKRNTSLIVPDFATTMLKGFPGNHFALKGGDAQQGTLETKWDGHRPSCYSPMTKQGAIVLAAGGDGSNVGSGLFYEGAITIGCPDSEEVDAAIQANIVAAQYSR